MLHQQTQFRAFGSSVKLCIRFHLWLRTAIGEPIGLAIRVPTLLDSPVSMPTWVEFSAAFERVNAARRRKDILFGIIRAIIQLTVALEGPGLDLLRIREAELEGSQNLSRYRLESFTSDLLDEPRALYPAPGPPIPDTPPPAERSRSPPRISVEGLSTPPVPPGPRPRYKGNRTPVPPKAKAVAGITGPSRAPRAVPAFVTPSSAAVFGAVPVSSSSGAGPSASSSPGAGPSALVSAAKPKPKRRPTQDRVSDGFPFWRNRQQQQRLHQHLLLWISLPKTGLDPSMDQASGLNPTRRQARGRFCASL